MASPAPDLHPSSLRPLAMGELVDRAAVLWRTHLWTLFRLFLVPQLLIYALTRALTEATRRWFPLLRGGAAMQEALAADPTAVLVQMPLYLGALLLFMGVSMWFSWTFNVAGTHYVLSAQVGRPPSLGRSVARAVSRLPQLTVTFALSALWGFGVTLLFLLPGIGIAALGIGLGGTGWIGVAAAAAGTVLALLGFIAGLLWYLLRFLITVQVVAMEELGPWATLRRSGELTSGRIGARFLERVRVRAMVLLSVLGAIALSVSVVTGLPALIVQSVYGHIWDPQLADPSAIPQLLLVPAELLQVFAQAFVAPLWAVFSALFYLDMRVRREGLDLSVRLGLDPGLTA